MKVLENGVDEQNLVAAAQQDPSRFADLYESNFDRVYAYVSRRVLHRHDAEDLTAEVFHAALRDLERLEWRGRPFAAWLMGIAAHLLADGWRHAAKRPEISTSDLERGDVGVDAIDFTIIDPKIEERAMLYQLVGELPLDQRQVILRRFVEQKSVREIALELGRSAGAIKQLQFRALQNLRMRIGSCHVERVHRRSTR
ncbi:MAG: sigma-70 family RNA polymerase sigma factor [Acidobacteriia bacterium]|nr:sigma-70 family RNA polymerase sigma factor [Terriglobia bacterium]